MAALIAFNAYMLSLVVSDKIDYNEDDDEDDDSDDNDEDDDDHGPPQLPPTIFLPGLLFDIHVLSQKQCIEQFNFSSRQIIEMSTLLDLLALVKTDKGDCALAVEALYLTLY